MSNSKISHCHNIFCKARTETKFHFIKGKYVKLLQHFCITRQTFSSIKEDLYLYVPRTSSKDLFYTICLTYPWLLSLNQHPNWYICTYLYTESVYHSSLVNNYIFRNSDTNKNLYTDIFVYHHWKYKINF